MIASRLVRVLVVHRALLLVAVLPLVVLGPVHAQETDDDQTLSPYFVVRSDDPTVDAMPLKGTSADVRIAGPIANVTVEQTYVNTGEKTLEATYVFPASTRAAVHAMTMQIGNRTLSAEVQEREQARKTYEEARDEGRSASLLEQQRPNVFQMRVANILPGDTIRVTLQYTESITPEAGTYEFVYPTVVGPRYADPTEDEATPRDQWVENPYLRGGEALPYTFDFTAEVAAGLPIQQVAVPSHDVDVTFDDSTRARIEVTGDDGGNRDVIVRYELRGKEITPGLLLHEGEEENHFLMMLQPPERVRADAVPPREYVFILDVSGSMRGFPLDVAKDVLRDLIGPLRPQDRFNVLLFAASSKVWSESSRPASEAAVADALSFIDRQRGGGGTELVSALREALALPRPEANVSRSVVVVTDGYVSFEREAFDVIRDGLGAANLFTFGIGSSVNRFLIEGMARAGMGEPFVVTASSEASAMASRFRRYVSTPALTQVEASFDGFDAYDVTPRRVPDLFAERPIVLFGKWRGRSDGTIRVRGRTGEGTFERSLRVNRFTPSRGDDGSNAALRYLWARHRIAQLSDAQQIRETDDTKQAITDLGLAYNLLTRYTSFVAVDTEVRADGEVVAVTQPLPLPQGVPNTAVGAPGMQPTASYSRQAAPGGLHQSMAEDARESHAVVESQPELIGGLDSLQARIQYPEEARAKGIQGRVLVRFTVDAQGRVQDATVVRGIHPLLDREALRVIRTARFRPAQKGGTPVKTQMTLPITFHLPPSETR